MYMYLDNYYSKIIFARDIVLMLKKVFRVGGGTSSVLHGQDKKRSCCIYFNDNFDFIPQPSSSCTCTM